MEWSTIKSWTYLVIMGDIVTAQLTFLGQEEVATFVPTVVFSE